MGYLELKHIETGSFTTFEDLSDEQLDDLINKYFGELEAAKRIRVWAQHDEQRIENLIRGINEEFSRREDEE